MHDSCIVKSYSDVDIGDNIDDETLIAAERGDIHHVETLADTTDIVEDTGMLNYHIINNIQIILTVSYLLSRKSLHYMFNKEATRII